MSSIARRRAEGKVRWSVEAGDVVFIGLDVHKRTVHFALMANGVIVKTWTMPYHPAAVVSSLKEFQGVASKIVYEAGPTGFGLARALKAAGFPVEVVAPSKTPRRPGPESKSDRLDCRKLAEYASKGMLRAVAIPTEQQEADRQVARLRAQCVKKVKRAKQQIKSLLLQHGIEEPKGLGHWSKASVEALKGLKLNRELRFCLNRIIEELLYLAGECRAIEAHLGTLSRTRRHRRAVEALDAHPGIGPITATAYAFEIFSPERFHTAEQVASYTGLAPRVSQSGQARREGTIFKSGREELRGLLIEAAWRWIARDPKARDVFYRMARNTGSSQKAIVAMARRLAIALWERLLQAQAQAA